ncbi:MAG: ParB family transcriptional regulator, chromosome partitioning protein [Blastocatellia bacterium]|jgi:ParB family chromosome partitioning protein|nr:ParB family transcriptional regulator, chromosome partitioning protein [Blastocatellia bacterium]
MRHDAHYVEELAQSRPAPIGRLIAIDKLDPNPDQPRREIGDLTELTDSIRERGVLEPLLVKPGPDTGRWLIIAGERRWRAAGQAGLHEVPCIEMNVDDQAVAEIALIENMQRKDLTPWEEADGLRALCERYGYTHEDVAKKVGKSRSTVTEALSIAALPESIRETCRRHGINAKSVLLEIVRQPDEESMRNMARDIAERGLTREGARQARRAQVDPAAAAAQPFIYRFESPDKEYKVEVKFRNSHATEEDIWNALRDAAESMEQ